MSKQRNSNIELLRLMAMIAIVFHHAIVHNADDLDAVENVPSRILLEFAGTFVGKTAVCVFFIISIWFLADRRLTFRDSCRRVWILEREILFYSVLCYLVYAPTMGTFSVKTLLTRFLPVITGEWWFVSDYVLLMLVLPFLTTGLKALSTRDHGILTVFSVAFFGFVQYLPYIGWSLKDSSGIMGLLTVTIVTCYIRWHGEARKHRFNERLIAAVSGTVAFALLVALYVLQCVNIPLVSTTASKLWTPMQDWHSLPVIIISIAIVGEASRAKAHHWPVIDRMASGTFAIYLITDTPEAELLLWTRLFPLHAIGGLPAVVVVILLIAAGVCMICTGIDLIRQALFHVSIDRNPGAWFDRLEAYGSDLKRR